MKGFPPLNSDSKPCVMSLKSSYSRSRYEVSDCRVTSGNSYLMAMLATRRSSVKGSRTCVPET